MTDADMTYWLSWCIEEFAAANKLVNTDVANLFQKTGALDYLQRNAEILHTQGRSYILSEITAYLQSASRKKPSSSYE